MIDKPAGPLRRGWTTGACATAATRAAYTALLTGRFPDPVTITLPRGQVPAFALTHAELKGDYAMAAIIKDAGDDPDVTHLATIQVTVRHGAPESGVRFRAGPGVGTVTKAGLPLGVGEPAINPVPRRMMMETIAEIAEAENAASDVEIEISVPGGEALAEKTWNPRLGILGGLSILGTTGIVVPFSCAAWIHAIYQGVDVARAAGLTHVAGCTGSTSEATVRRLLGLPELAMLDMGDFAGGLLKYLRRHPVERLTIGGGFAKISKLADGHLDLHSGRSQVDMAALSQRLQVLGAGAALVRQAAAANTAKEVLDLGLADGFDLATPVATDALATIAATLGVETIIDVVITDRAGGVLAHVQG